MEIARNLYDETAEKPDISIIIPVYNVEAYLPRCLDSIVKQQYSNFEAILIDDGSSDNSSKICDEYNIKDNRFKTIHVNNGGVGRARNIGIKNSKGKYITFVDSDDSVSPYYLSKLIDMITSYKSDMSICGEKFVSGNEPVRIEQQEKNNVEIYSMENAMLLMLYQKKINNSVWGKMFKRELFKDISFPENQIYEDLAIIHKIILKIKRAAYTGEALYYYTKREDSFIMSAFNRKTLDIIKTAKQQQEDLSNYKIFNKATKSRVLNSEMYVLRQIDKSRYPDIYRKIVKDIKQNRREVLLDSNTRKKTKLGIIVSYISFDLIRPVYKIFSNYKIVKSID